MPEYPTNNSRNQYIDYERYVSRLDHNLYHLSFEYYPLTKDEFKNQSKSRHAAHNYIGDITEDAYKISKCLIKALDAEPVRYSYFLSFKLTGQLEIFPKDLSGSLIDLQSLRHKIIHENELVNENLIAHSQLGKVIITGYATLEIAQAIKSWRRKPIGGLLVVDRSYLESKVASWPLFAETQSQICTKLANDGRLISININFDNVGTLIRRYPKLLDFSLF